MKDSITLSQDQEKAYYKIVKWLDDCRNKPSKKNKLLTLAGYAGCGKTTLVSNLAKEFQDSIRFAFCALSGRAASVLGNKLRDQGFEFDDHYCGTIHSLIYRPIQDENGRVTGWIKNHSMDFDIIVLDEASMISEKIFNDLAAYNIPILAVGDHGQLPPIEGNFSLMQRPDIKLEKIHRQVEDNPIINLSMQIRKTGNIPNGYVNNEFVKIISKSQYIDYLQELFEDSTPEKALETAVLCYTNNTRSRLNQLIRDMVFKSPPKTPIKDDIVICLKNYSNKDYQLYNGYRGYITKNTKEVNDHYLKTHIEFPYEKFDASVSKLLKYQFGYSKTFSAFSDLKQFDMYPKTWAQMGLLFDFGYAMTVHKSQGSSMNNVVVFNERPGPVSDEDYCRWLYTSVTRSSDKLVIVR